MIISSFLFFFSLNEIPRNFLLGEHLPPSSCVVSIDGVGFAADTSVDVRADASCCWKNKGSSYLSGSLLCEKKKWKGKKEKKQNKLLCPLCYQRECVQNQEREWNSYRRWCSLVWTQQTHWRDERCVLMKAAWEFNEASDELAWSEKGILIRGVFFFREIPTSVFFWAEKLL